MSVKIIGHRGARGLLPELSLAGFRKALEIGVDGMEIDVGITADGHVVAYHDYTLNPDITRMASGKWLDSDGAPLGNFTLTQLSQFDIGRINPDSDYQHQFPNQCPVDGSSIPTLEQVVELVKQAATDVMYCIEAKRNPVDPNLTTDLTQFVDTIVAEIHRLDIAAQTVIHSFDWSVIRQVKSVDSNLKVWHLTSQLTMFNTLAHEKYGAWTDGFELKHFDGSIPKMVIAAGGDAWSSDCQSLNSDVIAQAHDLGLEVYCWTVNEISDIERMCQCGVDGIITDYPDRVVQYLNET